jgi:uncharacterized hydrophobic protein (TIGR00271 family)
VVRRHIRAQSRNPTTSVVGSANGQDGFVLHLRLIVPRRLTDVVIDRLLVTPGVAHVVRHAGSAIRPEGELVSCDVAREATNEVIEWLQEQGVHREGAITVEALEAVVSDAAAVAEEIAPGHGADALVWEELEARTRSEAILTASFLTLMAVAATIAAVGILLDSPILIIGAMVVGPEYGPLAALCVAIVRRRSGPARTAGGTLMVGLIVAAGAALVATALFRVTSLAPESYELGDRELTAFISHPNGMAAVVAVLAGVVGMLALTEARSGVLVGVLVSVTTIPAAGNVGVATAYRQWSEVAGAAMQLGVNVAGLVAAGVTTLAVQARFTTRLPRLRTSTQAR